MNLGRTWTVLLACGTAALLATAPAASAKPGYVVFQGYHAVALSLQGSHGYRIDIVKQGHRYVYLLAGKEPSFVSYLTRSLEPKGSEIKARFPGIGRISVRFLPKGPPRTKPPFFSRCKGGGTVIQRGYFVGTIRFRGERGYTSVRATWAKGKIETAAREICKDSMFDDDPEPIADRTELFARSISNHRGAAFDVSQHGDPINLTSFGGTVVERSKGMTIARSAFAIGEKSDVVIGDTRPFPLSATITPPPPFSGSAEYRRTPDGDRTWTGSLAVSLPGLGRVDLTGPSFSALLCQHSGCTGNTIDGHRLPLIAGNPASKVLPLRSPLARPTPHG